MTPQRSVSDLEEHRVLLGNIRYDWYEHCTERAYEQSENRGHHLYWWSLRFELDPKPGQLWLTDPNRALDSWLEYLTYKTQTTGPYDMSDPKHLASGPCLTCQKETDDFCVMPEGPVVFCCSTSCSAAIQKKFPYLNTPNLEIEQSTSTARDIVQSFCDAFVGDGGALMLKGVLLAGPDIQKAINRHFLYRPDKADAERAALKEIVETRAEYVKSFLEKMGVE